MTLDLSELVAGWDPGDDDEEPKARLVAGMDGRQHVQLRVDLGVLQMQMDQRPDGAPYRGFPSVLDYFDHETAINGSPEADDWDELLREFEQFNFRRLALTSVAEDAMAEEDPKAVEMVDRAARDIDHCVRILRLMRATGSDHDDVDEALLPMLVFNRARLNVRRFLIAGEYVEAIDAADAGMRDLLTALEEVGRGSEAAADEDDAGVRYLRQLRDRIRERHAVGPTIREQLADALEREDYETAARLRDRLERGDPPEETPRKKSRKTKSKKKATRRSAPPKSDS